MQYINNITPITFYNVRKHIAKQPVLNIREFTISRSSCLFLSGNNGTGKTTLLKIISGLMMPDHAEIIYRGQRLPWSNAKSLVQRDTIYLHQSPYVFDGSVIDNIAYGLRCRGYTSAEINDRVDMALYWSGLVEFAKRDARQLSGGEKQRVVLTRAWILKPQILLLDEPLTGLDYNARTQTLSLIEQLMSEGMGIVVTGHDLQSSLSFATQHLHLHQGKLVPFEQRALNNTAVTTPSPQALPQFNLDDASLDKVGSLW